MTGDGRTSSFPRSLSPVIPHSLPLFNHPGNYGMLGNSWEHVGMEESTQRKVKKIIGQMNCPKDFSATSPGSRLFAKPQTLVCNLI
jgi:hypothetical protein